MYKNKKKGLFSLLLNRMFDDKLKNKKEFLLIIKEAKKNKFINKHTYYMIKGVINIEKKKVKDIMIPRIKITKLKINDQLNTCLNKIIKSKHSRFPVISKNNTQVYGFLIAKDLFQFIKNSKKKFCLKNIIRPAVIVPESQRLDKILQEFRIKRNHIAIVVDEFGVITGLVTIEDVLETILKNINHKNFCIKK
ncbi:MAG: CBS domain-containing protein [Buchnera aphidicola (Periphyllus lyropictus)]|uniref:CBS domain-containing protein n=1 Tax=Buchnera aphidicola TaxID=9 RepID=UPI001ECACB3D|nr:CBS domain-containing protein [Buchnera aphidicola]NIH16538.1 CBS domain-containing protein [Buchnera aphidicola (Periphyllus lyropictus)]USS94431.1 CBS domain-containing protein [Buchnera aphidicola (Periphyllus lyropictus)]